MSQPSFHDVQKQIGDRVSLAIGHPRRTFSMFGSANPLVSTAQLKQSADILDIDIQPALTRQLNATMELKATMIAVASIMRASSPSEQEKMLTPMQEPLGERVKARRTGPVQVLGKIANDWQLSRAELALLLAYPNDQSAADLLDGRASLRNPDREDRVRLLYRIYRILSSLFPDVARQNAWLRATNENLRNKSPLEFMIEHRIPGMISVQNLVERLAAR